MDGQKIEQQFSEWLCREMPAGTIIGDPKWWVPKIVRAVLRGLSQERAEPVAWEIWQPLGQKTVTYSKDEAVRCMLRADLVVRTLTYADASPAASGTVQVPTTPNQEYWDAVWERIQQDGYITGSSSVAQIKRILDACHAAMLAASPKEGK